MQAHAFNVDGAAILVVSRVLDEGVVDGIVHAAPGVDVVVRLQNVFSRVIQIAISQQKTQAAIAQVILVVLFDRISDEGDSHFILFAMPARTGIVSAQ